MFYPLCVDDKIINIKCNSWQHTQRMQTQKSWLIVDKQSGLDIVKKSINQEIVENNSTPDVDSRVLCIKLGFRNNEISFIKVWIDNEDYIYIKAGYNLLHEILSMFLVDPPVLY